MFSTSGLLLLPRCTSHTPSWLTRQRSFLSRIYSSDMYVCPLAAEKLNADEEHRIFILFLLRTLTDMYIHGKKTDFGAPIPIICILSLAQLYRRHKNRLQLGPEARCVGIDMNRYAVPNLIPNAFTNSCFL